MARSRSEIWMMNSAQTRGGEEVPPTAATTRSLRVFVWHFSGSIGNQCQAHSSVRLRGAGGARVLQTVCTDGLKLSGTF